MILSKQKQTALLKLGGVTALVLIALWYFLVHSTQMRVSQNDAALNSLTQKIATKKLIIQKDDQVKTQMAENARRLREIEDQMVTGDVYLWIEKTLRDFEIRDQIEFTKYDPPQTVDSELPQKLPYKTVSFSVSGSAAYHDLGTFLANFENSYPHIRIRRLEMEPAAIGPSKNEKLTFLIEMQVLVKPGNPRSKPRT